MNRIEDYINEYSKRELNQEFEDYVCDLIIQKNAVDLCEKLYDFLGEFVDDQINKKIDDITFMINCEKIK